MSVQKRSITRVGVWWVVTKHTLLLVAMFCDDVVGYGEVHGIDHTKPTTSEWTLCVCMCAKRLLSDYEGGLA